MGSASGRGEKRDATEVRSPRFVTAARLAGGFVWKAARNDFILSIAGEVVGAVALAGVLLSGRQLVTELAGDAPVDQVRAVLPETLLLGACLIVSGLAAVLVRQLRWLVSERVTRYVESEIVTVCSSVDYERYEQPQFHDLLERSNSQASQSSYQLVYDVLGLFNMLATSIVVVLVLVQSVPEVLGALLLIGVPSVVAARLSARLAFQTTYKLTADDRLRHYVYRALTARSEARELRIFGTADVLRARWARLYDGRMKRLRSLVWRQVLFNGLAAAIAALLVAVVLLILVKAAVNGRISLGDAAVAIVALQQLATRLRSAASASGSLRQSTLFLEDFERFRRLGSGVETAAFRPQGLPQGPLIVDHVSFRYPGTEALVLDDVSLEIASGSITALVGVSGSGKTTLAHLVAGLYRPTAGRITLGGVDISSIPRPLYWSGVAAVFQDFVRYELTARENIALSDYSRVDDMRAVAEAAGRAGVDRAIERLSDGYETVMSRSYEAGGDLSVGQWQRVAIARAFFRQSPLLILDEPAAALDAVAEQQLYERMVELSQSRSTLLISHRFSTVRMADRIGVMKDGRIVEQGTHAELMAIGGHYAEMFNLQASSYLSEDPPNARSDASRL